MSYPEPKDGFLENLLNRKEFYSLRGAVNGDNPRDFRDPPEADDFLAGKFLKLRSHQVFVKNFMNPNTPYKRLHLMHSTGTGKCHGKDTPILQFDGRVKMAQDIVPGDLLMGDDSKPRTVQSIASGQEALYKIIPARGKSFICNESHILTLATQDSPTSAINISIRRYISTSRNFRSRYKLYRVAVDFPPTTTDCDPYIFGYIAATAGVFVDIPTVDILDYFLVKLPRAAVVRVVTGTRYIIMRKYFFNYDNSVFTITPFEIPHNFKCSSRANRLKLLAGIIDAAGGFDTSEQNAGNLSNLRSKHVIECVSDSFAEEILFICYSLGFDAHKKKRDSKSYSVSIRGDLSIIPVLTNGTVDVNLVENIAENTTDISDPIPRQFVDFSISRLGVGNYYGFTLDGNHRYLLGDFIVTHNTLAALGIANEFVKVYRKLYASDATKLPPGRRSFGELDQMTPNVFILGFGGTSTAFTNELLRHPYFGFVNTSEKEEMYRLRGRAAGEMPDDVKRLHDYRNYIKRRITSKHLGGFYKFYGYDAFVNRLFLSENIKLTELEIIAAQRAKAGENITVTDVILEEAKAGRIQVNHTLLESFENSLIVADEIHNTYNMTMKNNRGIALQFVLDTVSTVRFLSLSATPINNSPSEAVELINYLVPREQKVTKKDLFVNPKTLAPGKLELIGRLSHGRISFLQDVNVKYFPRRVILGEPIILDKPVGKLPSGSRVPYLKFIHCPMSKLHQATYESHKASMAFASRGVMSDIQEFLVDPAGDGAEDGTGDGSTGDGAEDEKLGGDMAEAVSEYHSIPTDGYAIYDMVFPDPSREDIGMFRSTKVTNQIVSAPQKWRDDNKITTVSQAGRRKLITGDFLARESLGKYSSKYLTLVNTILDIMAQSGGDPDKCSKVMIYHNMVGMSGVLLIQELLIANNILDETSEPVDATICCICLKPLSDHGDVKHLFTPARFVIAHSDVDTPVMKSSLDRFNDPANAHGLKYMFLIGSKIIKESYDFKDIQHLIILSLPINIPTLIQVFGRCIRANSHINLPPRQRVVNISILLTTTNPNFYTTDSISPEVYRYAEKLSEYVVIQNIERAFNAHAIDANVHRDIIMPPDLRKEYFPDGTTEPVDVLGNLYFEPPSVLPYYKPKDLNNTTFDAYKYYDEEIKTISYLIKRLFMMHSVWTYDDLWATIRLPPFGVEVNPEFFNEHNFIIALHNLVSSVTPIVSASSAITDNRLVDLLFDYSERFIHVGGKKHKIEHIDDYYILFPIDESPGNPINSVYAEYTENVRDPERLMIKSLRVPTNKPVVDVEYYLRGTSRSGMTRINIDKYVQSSRESINYMAKRDEFVRRYVGRTDIGEFLVGFSSRFQILFVEEAIIAAGGKDEVNERSVLYGRVLDLMRKFKVLVTVGEVTKYKDVAKHYKNGVPTLPTDTPLGYMSSKIVRLFDPDAVKWFSVSKLSLNRHPIYRENDVIIGYLETAEDTMNFKLRSPIHKIKMDIKEADSERRSKTGKAARTKSVSGAIRGFAGDARLVERGTVCSFKNKRELLKIMAALGLSTRTMDKSEIRIKKLCATIKAELTRLEMKERAKDSKYKYLYSWWDELLDLNSLV